MMRAKADPKATSNLILGLACVLMLGSIYVLLGLKPRAEMHTIDTRKARESIAVAQRDLKTAQAEVGAHTWVGEDAEITGGVYSLTTALARKRNVTFVRMQPQRFTLGIPLEQLPYLIVVEGKFPDVVALEKDLEVPANRLAVNAIQLASSDSETNKVSANIAVVAQRVGTSVGTTENKNVKGS